MRCYSSPWCGIVGFSTWAIGADRWLVCQAVWDGDWCGARAKHPSTDGEGNQCAFLTGAVLILKLQHVDMPSRTPASGEKRPELACGAAFSCFMDPLASWLEMRQADPVGALLCAPLTSLLHDGGGCVQSC